MHFLLKSLQTINVSIKTVMKIIMLREKKTLQYIILHVDEYHDDSLRRH